MAKVKTIVLGKHHVSVDIPKTWRSETDSALFGIPFLVLGPMDMNSRVTVSFVDTKLENVKMNFQSLSNNYDQYRNGRKKWVKKYNGEVVSFIPYTKTKWSGIDEAHVVGFRYKVNKSLFIEKSYYIMCSKRFYNIKFLFKSRLEKKYLGQTEKLIESFKCL